MCQCSLEMVSIKMSTRSVNAKHPQAVISHSLCRCSMWNFPVWWQLFVLDHLEVLTCSDSVAGFQQNQVAGAIVLVHPAQHIFCVSEISPHCGETDLLPSKLSVKSQDLLHAKSIWLKNKTQSGFYTAGIQPHMPVGHQSSCRGGKKNPFLFIIKNTQRGAHEKVSKWSKTTKRFC